jgi:DNA adenine methylase
MRYDGGKGAMGVAQWIINQIPPHRVYIEPFLGGGAVLRLKAPAGSSIGIERDTRAVELWRGHNLPDLRIIHGDGISFLAKFRPRGDEFIYCDPPYLFSTRTSQVPIYRCELTDSDHARLLRILKHISCSIAVSGYWSELYGRELASWRRSSFLTTKRNHERAEECLWMNYPEPVALHDYRYLGRNFRERERIKRKKTRWANRLARMPLLERRLLVATLAETDAGRSIIGGKGEFGRDAVANRDRIPTSTIGSMDGQTSPVAAGRIARNGDASGSGRYRRKRCGSPAVIAGKSEG